MIDVEQYVANLRKINPEKFANVSDNQLYNFGKLN